MVIHHRPALVLAFADLDRPFVVHLPEVVGLGVRKAGLHRFIDLRHGRGSRELMTAEDGGDRADRAEVLAVLAAKDGVEFAGAPAVAFAEFEDAGFESVGDAAVWSPRRTGSVGE